jgi:hypothetical protein
MNKERREKMSWRAEYIMLPGASFSPFEIETLCNEDVPEALDYIEVLERALVIARRVVVYEVYGIGVDEGKEKERAAIERWKEQARAELAGGEDE